MSNPVTSIATTQVDSSEFSKTPENPPPEKNPEIEPGSPPEIEPDNIPEIAPDFPPVIAPDSPPEIVPDPSPEFDPNPNPNWLAMISSAGGIKCSMLQT